jgi:hypothetical protein
MLVCSVSFRRSDWMTTTGRTFPGSVPRRGFKSAAQSSPLRGDRSGILQAFANQRIQLPRRLETGGPNARGSFAELSPKLLAGNGLLQQFQRAANNLGVGPSLEQSAQSKDLSVFRRGQSKRRFSGGMRLHTYFIPRKHMGTQTRADARNTGSAEPEARRSHRARELGPLGNQGKAGGRYHYDDSSIRMLLCDQPAFVRVLPDLEPRTRRPPRIHHFVVAPLAGRHPFKEIEHQRFDWIEGGFVCLHRRYTRSATPTPLAPLGRADESAAWRVSPVPRELPSQDLRDTRGRLPLLF